MNDSINRCIVCGSPTSDLTCLCDEHWKHVDETGESREAYLPLVGKDDEGRIVDLAFIHKEAILQLDDFPKVAKELIENSTDYLPLPLPMMKILGDMVEQALYGADGEA